MNTTAKEILNQLGGNKFCAMTGAKNFVYGDSMLMFAIGKGAKGGINKVRVTLDPSDTYTVEFFKLRGVDCKQIASVDMVYADGLRAVFTSHTGFDCTL